MNEFAELLIKNNISIGTVESFTVGNFATMLGNIPGISKVYKGSLVTYQSETKERLLGIEHPLIEKYGVVSKEIATLMCVNGKSIFYRKCWTGCNGRKTSRRSLYWYCL